MSEHGEIVGEQSPAPDGLELFDGRQIDAWIATDHDQDSVGEAAAGVSEVATDEVAELDAVQVGAAAAEPQAREPEQQPLPAAAAAPPPRATRTVRVDAGRLDSLMHLMGELVIHRTAVDAITDGTRRPGLPAGRAGARRAAPTRCRRWSCRCA